MKAGVVAAFSSTSSTRQAQRSDSCKMLQDSILLDSIGFYWILLDSIGFYWILLDSIGMVGLVVTNSYLDTMVQLCLVTSRVPHLVGSFFAITSSHARPWPTCA